MRYNVLSPVSTMQKRFIHRSISVVLPLLFSLAGCLGGGTEKEVDGKGFAGRTTKSISQFVAEFPVVLPKEEVFCRSLDAEVDAPLAYLNPEIPLASSNPALEILALSDADKTPDTFDFTLFTNPQLTSRLSPMYYANLAESAALFYSLTSTEAPNLVLNPTSQVEGDYYFGFSVGTIAGVKYQHNVLCRLSNNMKTQFQKAFNLNQVVSNLNLEYEQAYRDAEALGVWNPVTSSLIGQWKSGCTVNYQGWSFILNIEFTESHRAKVKRTVYLGSNCTNPQHEFEVLIEDAQMVESDNQRVVRGIVESTGYTTLNSNWTSVANISRLCGHIGYQQNVRIEVSDRYCQFISPKGSPVLFLLNDSNLPAAYLPFGQMDMPEQLGPISLFKY